MLDPHAVTSPPEELVAESVKEAAPISAKQVNDAQRVGMTAVFVAIGFWLVTIGIAIWSYTDDNPDSSTAQKESKRRLETHLRQYADTPLDRLLGTVEFQRNQDQAAQAQQQKQPIAAAEIDFSKYIHNEREEESRHQGQSAAEIVRSADSPTQSSQGQFTQIIERVEPSVVAIRTQKGQPLGSGFIFDSDNGIVVTNLHVIVGQSALVISFHDGQTENVLGFLGISESNDLATLKVGSLGKRYPRLKVADRLPSKGANVLAVGNPWGLTGSVTNGIVSSIRKASEFGHAGSGEWIQHSAPISPGNSGGPLVDTEGVVVGVNTLVLNPQFGQNINFAVASPHIRQVVRNGSDVVKPLTDLPVRDKPETAVANPEKKPVDSNQSLDEAQRRLAVGQFREALRTLEAVPAKNRGAGYWRVRARTLFLIGDYRDSAAGYATSLQLDSTDSDTRIRFATALRLDSLNNYEGIVTACRAALKIAPTDARAYHILGVTLRERKDQIDALNSALALDDTHLGTHFQIGCRFAGERKAEARKHFKKALDLIDMVDDFEVFSSERYSVNSFSQRNSFETVLRLHLAAVCDGDEATSICHDVLKSEPENGAAYWLLGMQTRGLGARRNIDPNRNPTADALQAKGTSFGSNLEHVISLGAGTTGILVFRR